MIITIDGPVATGKSTIAKKLASSVGFIYYDTGAMYRAVALDMINKKVDINSEDELNKYLESFDFRIKILHGERKYFIGQDDVTSKIRTEAVSKAASIVSSNPKVREKLVVFQREASKGVNAVFEGRDMGTIVFPDAELKIFLTGRDDVRAVRRFEELIAKFPDDRENISLENVLNDLKERDQFDSNRQSSPLKKADDAYEIDTSDLTIDEIVYKILECKDMAAARRKREKEKPAT